MKIQTSYSSIWATAIITLLTEKGLNGFEIARECGVNLDEIKGPTAVCSGAAMAALWKRTGVELREHAGIVERSQVGVEVAKQINLASFDALSFLLMASDNLVSAFRRFINYLNIVNQEFSLRFGEEDGNYRLDVNISSVCDEVPQESVDALMALMVRLARFLDKSDHNPLEVHLCRPMPIMSRAAELYFGVAVSYQAMSNTLIFSKQRFEKTLKTADFGVAQKNDQIVSQFIIAFEKTQIAYRVKRYVLERLPEGTPTAEGVAREMGISKRTLQRYLNAQNTTFKEILDENRKALAHNYLAEGVKNVCELTYRLGFSDASSFCRAFKRWYGCSTSQYLYQLRQARRSELNTAPTKTSELSVAPNAQQEIAIPSHSAGLGRTETV